MAQYLDDIDYWTLSAADRLLLVQDILDSVLAENQDDALTPDLAGGRRWRLPRHLPSTYRRLNALSPSVKWIFDAVIHTLQNAEETRRRPCLPRPNQFGVDSTAGVWHVSTPQLTPPTPCPVIPAPRASNPASTLP